MEKCPFGNARQVEDLMKTAFYKDTFANNCGADSAVKNITVGVNERRYTITLFEKSGVAENAYGDYDKKRNAAYHLQNWELMTGRKKLI